MIPGVAVATLVLLIAPPAVTRAAGTPVSLLTITITIISGSSITVAILLAPGREVEVLVPRRRYPPAARRLGWGRAAVRGRGRDQDQSVPGLRGAGDRCHAHCDEE